MALVLNSETQRHVRQLVQTPPQSLIISGPTGIGKMTIAYSLAKALLQAPPESHRYFKQLAAEDGIAAVRDLQGFISLKTVGGTGGPIRRIALIDSADELSQEAQNALLKLLEEPACDTMIILLASQPQRLLATVHSRSQHITIQKPSTSDLQAHFTGAGYDAPLVAQAIQYGAGLPGRVTAILATDEDNPTSKAVAQARTILQANKFERLALVDGLSKQRPLAIDCLQMIGQMSEAALLQLARVNPADGQKRAQNWQYIMDIVTEAEERLRNNGQAKLILTDCMLRLP